jgi:hypothetical protein
MFNSGAISDSDAIQLSSLNYPDPRLITGSVCIRKYVYPEPAITFRPPFIRESSINVIRTQDAIPRHVLVAIRDFLVLRSRKRGIIANFKTELEQTS